MFASAMCTELSMLKNRKDIRSRSALAQRVVPGNTGLNNEIKDRSQEQTEIKTIELARAG